MPKAGEIWLADLGLAAKVRPCLVLSVPVAEQDRALVTAVAHTTSPRGSRFEVAITTPEGWTLERTDQTFREIETKLKNNRGVINVLAAIGDTTGRFSRGQGEVTRAVARAAPGPPARGGGRRGPLGHEVLLLANGESG